MSVVFWELDLAVVSCELATKVSDFEGVFSLFVKYPFYSQTPEFNPWFIPFFCPMPTCSMLQRSTAFMPVGPNVKFNNVNFRRVI
jgi:hypothetical protein